MKNVPLCNKIQYEGNKYQMRSKNKDSGKMLPKLCNKK